MQQKVGTNVVEVTDENFVETVIEGSKERPVVVDLWATWCPPCRIIGPILEKVAAEREGAFLLAKLDVDANPQTAAAFGVQSIPTIVAFKDGQAVEGFVGAIPEPAVNEFVDKLMPTAADVETAHARDVAEAGDEAEAEAEAEAAYRKALEDDPNSRTARVGLGQLLVERGDHDEARQVLMPALPDQNAERLLARISVAEWGASQEPGTLASAKRLAAKGQWREALDGMLGALGDDPDARQAILEVFAVLGDEDELVQEYRPKLAAALF